MLITCYKITYNFIVSENLNKGKILYLQEEDNTDNERECVIRGRRNDVFIIDRNDRLYRNEKVKLLCMHSDGGLHMLNVRT